MDREAVEILRGKATGMPQWVKEFLPKILPAGWGQYDNARDLAFGRVWFGQTSVVISANAPRGLGVCVSGIVRNKKRWIHVSFSRPNRIPSYEDMVLVKNIFIGADKQAIQIIAKENEHVNDHPYCLHLWHCIDGDGLPDFRERIEYKGEVFYGL